MNYPLLYPSEPPTIFRKLGEELHDFGQLNVFVIHGAPAPGIPEHENSVHVPRFESGVSNLRSYTFPAVFWDPFPSISYFRHERYTSCHHESHLPQLLATPRPARFDLCLEPTVMTATRYVPRSWATTNRQESALKKEAYQIGSRDGLWGGPVCYPSLRAVGPSGSC